MIPQPKICGLRKLINTVKRCSDAGERFCFIIGAGASVSSGIDSGATMASLWLDDLKKYEPELTEKWLADNKVDETNIGSHYSKLYEMRFSAHPLDGYIWLQNKMKDATPGLGYYHLANILAADNASINLVISTNFDSLTEDAIFMYTGKKPLVVTHELLAQYMDFLANRPIIAKIHRDLMLRPKSSEEETKRLAEAWEPVLRKALSIYSPIVIGYGGNDDSLMGLLETAVKENGMEKPIYWCHTHNHPPKNEKILELLNKSGGFLVPIADFDTAMYLFGVEFGHNFSEKSLTEQIQTRIDIYKTRRKEIEDDLKKQQESRALSDDEEAVVNAISEAKRNELDKLNEKISKNPNNASLYFQRGNFYSSINKENEAVMDYSKAINLDSSNASYYNYRGNSYHFLREYEKAIADYSKAIDLDSGIATYYSNRGNSYSWLMEQRQAIADYSKAIDLDSGIAVFYNNRGGSFGWLREYEKAIADYSKAIELNSGVAKYHAKLAFALFKIGNIDEALKTLENSMTFDSDKSLCYRYRGLIHLRLAKRNKAECPPEVLDDLNKSFELRTSNDPMYYNSFAEYYLYIGELDNAYTNLQKALSEYEKDGCTWYYLAQYYAAKEDTQEYERCMAKSQEYKYIPDNDVFSHERR